MPDTPITPRRSKRYQQLVTPVHRSAWTDKSTFWTGEAHFTRESTYEDYQVLAEDHDWKPQPGMQTAFYRSFTRSQPILPSSFTSRKPRSARSEQCTHEVFNVGDTVCVRTSSVKYNSVGVIVSMWELRTEASETDQSGVFVRVHWFQRPVELPQFRAKREHVENEVYFTLDTEAVLPPSSIVCHCTVSDKPPEYEEEDAKSEGSSKRRLRMLVKQDDIRDFYCRFALDSRKGLYYDFDWPKHRTHALSELVEQPSGEYWNVAVMSPSRKQQTQKRPRVSKIPEETPRKNRTPKLVAPTPHSKAALRKRGRKAPGVRVPPPDFTQEHYKQLQKLPQDPWLRAMHVLHVAARPDILPCREEEYNRVLRTVEELLEEGSSGCIYISGVPGTGKTATVHAVVRELKRMAESGETNPFTYVEINGLKIPEPSAAYNLLWEAVSGHDVVAEGHLKVSSKEALKQLNNHFSAGVRAGPGGHACIVLMDELDQLVTAKQDVVYNFFNWPTLVGSKLVVLAVANTMDLPERALNGRVRSRLGMIRINFQPYATPQLEKIVHARLIAAKEDPSDQQDVISADAVKFASMKVSSISGDARRVLDICRRAVELVHPRGKTAGMDDVKEVIKVMQNSPTAAYLKECSLHERIMLASLLKCVKREGVEEIKWGEIQQQHVIYIDVLGEGESTRKPSLGELTLVLDSLLASRAILMEDGLTAARKPASERRVILNLEQTEVERVLGDVGGERWRNALGVGA